jgi:Icc-related predicted phosphoesterase
MKILVAADLHYALKQYDWLKSVAADFDVVVLAGDLLEISSSVERRAQIVVVRAYLEELVARTRVSSARATTTSTAATPEGELIARWVAELAEIGVTADWGSVTWAARSSPSARGGTGRRRAPRSAASSRRMR